MYGLDVVAVEIADEPAVVVGVVVRPQAGLVEHLDALGPCRFDERVDLLLRLRPEPRRPNPRAASPTAGRCTRASTSSPTAGSSTRE